MFDKLNILLYFICVYYKFCYNYLNWKQLKQTYEVTKDLSNFNIPVTFNIFSLCVKLIVADNFLTRSFW